MYHPVTTQAMHDAARATQECEAICIDTIRYCLQQGGAHVESSHIRNDSRSPLMVTLESSRRTSSK